MGEGKGDRIKGTHMEHRETLRIKNSFNKWWSFSKGDIKGAESPDFDDSGWEEVALPHCWNAEDTFTGPRGYYRGPGWYRKSFRVDSELSSRRICLEFEAVFSIADVWVNGGYVGQFMGGYTGFYVDITDKVFFGDAINVISIKVDNSHNPDVLPGREIPDYNLYGGIYREVWFLSLYSLHIAHRGVRITTPSAGEKLGSVKTAIEIRNDSPDPKECKVTLDIYDPYGRRVASAWDSDFINSRSLKTLDISTDEIRKPLLWSPDAPNLYKALVTVYDGHMAVDSAEIPFGFRWFRFDPEEGFYLNGGHLKLKGVNRHQCYPGLGNALPVSLQIKDAEIIKDMGGNFVRASHYPQHPAFLDACDRLGILVYEEIASWQYIGGEKFMENAEKMLVEMIQRDRNHPSIVIWGILNEGRSKEMFERLNRKSHIEDQTRVTAYAENKPDEGNQLGTTYVTDVLGINYKLPHIDSIHSLMPGRPLLNSEHTNADYAARGDLDLEMKQVEKLEVDLGVISSRPYLAGGALWSMHDYGTDYEPVWPIQKSGVLDMYRIPKEGYHLCRSLWLERPMVHIGGHWSWRGFEGKPLRVRVYSNCDLVELFLNGGSLGSKKRSEGFIWDVPYSPGTLKAIGTKGEFKVVSEKHTSRSPARLVLSADPLEIPAGGCEVSVITVTAVDADGSLADTADLDISFSVEGEGILKGIGGRDRTELKAGIGRIILQSTVNPGEVKVMAISPGLEPGEVSVKTLLA